MATRERTFVFAASSFIAGFILCYLFFGGAQPKPAPAMIVANSPAPATTRATPLRSVAEDVRTIVAPFAPHPYSPNPVPTAPPYVFPVSQFGSEPQHPPHDDSLGKYSTDLIDFRSKPDFKVEPAQ